MTKQMHHRGRLLAAAFAALGATSATAVNFDNGTVSGNFNSAITVGFGVRTKAPSCDTIIGTFAGSPAQPTGSGAPKGCIDALSMINDQGNLNYGKGDFFTAYLKGVNELYLKMPDQWTFFGRVSWLADAAATHATGYLSGGGNGRSFTGESASELRFKPRLLDLWINKDFDLNGQQARVRVGNQVISWGESLFLPGGINQTNAMDLMRLSQPGTQLQEVFLPAPIVSFASGLGHGLNVEAYVQAQWNAFYFPPVGSYWSTATIGTGADGYGIFKTPTPHTPNNGGQYGIALHYQPTGTQVNFGVYAMRYTDKTPNVNYADPATASGGFYSYLDDRTLYGVSVNFPLGDWAIGSELSYRPKDAVSLNPLAANNIDGGACLVGGRCYVDEKKFQANLTALLSLTPSDYGPILKLLGNPDTATLLAEAVVVNYPNLKSTYQGIPSAPGYWGWGFLNASSPSFGTPQQGVGTKTSWGYNFDFSWTYDGSLIKGWQVTPEIYYFQAVSGRTPNAMALFMEGAKSANFILTFAQNPTTWKFGINYAAFWGGSSILDQPLRNRNFVGAYVTRNF